MRKKVYASLDCCPRCAPQLTLSVKFPITAIREIKILKVLSHPNVLQLKEMAVERSKGKRWPFVAWNLGRGLRIDTCFRRGTEETQHVHGYPIYGT